MYFKQSGELELKSQISNGRRMDWYSVRFPLLFLLAIPLLSATSINASAHTKKVGIIGRRVLLSFKETPRGSNLTYDCSRSGPCVPCLYSEKSDERYRCSETGYRIPFKCVEIKHDLKEKDGKQPKNTRSAMELLPDTTVSNKGRSLMEDSPTSEEGGSLAYITYRSCIPLAVNEEEKLSVLGFEAIILFLLLTSGLVVYFRRKQTFSMSGVGAGRIQTNSRF